MEVREFDALPDLISREDLPGGHWAMALSRPGEKIPKGVLLIPEHSGPVTPEVEAWVDGVIREREVVHGK